MSIIEKLIKNNNEFVVDLTNFLLVHEKAITYKNNFLSCNFKTLKKISIVNDSSSTIKLVDIFLYVKKTDTAMCCLLSSHVDTISESYFITNDIIFKKKMNPLIKYKSHIMNYRKTQIKSQTKFLCTYAKSLIHMTLCDFLCEDVVFNIVSFL